MGRIFTAQYRGGCPECGERIDEGEDVSFNVDDQVVHSDCDPDSYT